jgi:hypothetical protein
MPTDAASAPDGRLFVSIDIAGSTAFKASRPTEQWLPVFRAFFEHFPLVLLGQLAEAFEDAQDLPPLALWKASGDELVFDAPLPETAETVALLRAVFEAARLYGQRAFAELPLDLKTTAWSATFQPNARVEIPEIADRTGAAYVDFIGPDIDLGFRLTSQAQPGSMLVSLDLAERLLAPCIAAGGVLVADGVAALKGVAGGQFYPVLRLGFASGEPFATGLHLCDTQLQALSLGRACVAGEAPLRRIEAFFIRLRRQAPDPWGAFESSLAMLGEVPAAIRNAGRMAIEASGPDHPYHNRHHLAETILAMGWLCAATRAAGTITPEQAWLGVLAMAGHDLGHDGRRDTGGQLETQAAQAMQRIGATAGLTQDALETLRAVILATAPDAVTAATGARPGQGAAGLLGSLAREADIAASLMLRLGWRLTAALHREWTAVGATDAESLLGFRARLRLLSRYADLSEAAQAIGLSRSVGQQRGAFVRLADSRDEYEAASALDAMAPKAAARLYRQACHAASLPEGQR